MTGPGSSCGACKFLRRKCTSDCVFAPCFSYDQASTHFAAVHKVFGASNVSKLLLHLPVHARSDAAATISYEALARMNDPVYGCVAHIFALQEQVANLQEEIELLGTQMANLGGFPSCGDQFNDCSFFNEVGLHISESNRNNNDRNVVFCQNQVDPLLCHTEIAASNMMNAGFPGLCAWECQNHNPSYENDPNLMDKLFEGIAHGTCPPSYPWPVNDVCQ